MKKLFFFMACIMMVMEVGAQTLVLPNGKNIPIRLTSEIRSNFKGEIPMTPTAIVDADIKDDNG